MPIFKVTGLLCDKFVGSSNVAPVDRWLEIFETVTTGYTDVQKIFTLARHLASDAIE
jgi:hypothetical protein